jgi:hypothetical protein
MKNMPKLYDFVCSRCEKPSRKIARKRPRTCEKCVIQNRKDNSRANNGISKMIRAHDKQKKQSKTFKTGLMAGDTMAAHSIMREMKSIYWATGVECE